MSQTFSILLRERVKRYRAQANEIRAKAERYPSEIRASFFRIAEYWEQLAAEAEAKDEKDLAATAQKTQTAANSVASEPAGESRNAAPA